MEDTVVVAPGTTVRGIEVGAAVFVEDADVGDDVLVGDAAVADGALVGAMVLDGDEVLVGDAVGEFVGVTGADPAHPIINRHNATVAIADRRFDFILLMLELSLRAKSRSLVLKTEISRPAECAHSK